MNKGFNRKRFEYKSAVDNFFALNTSRNTYFALLFTFFGSIMMLGLLIVPFIVKEKIGFDFILANSVLFIIGIISFRQFLWLINGRQELLIEEGKMSITKKGTFWKSPKIYSLNDISDVREGVDEDKLSDYERVLYNMKLGRRIIFSHITGQILFDYKGQAVKLFCDLTKEERTILINAINKAL